MRALAILSVMFFHARAIVGGPVPTAWHEEAMFGLATGGWVGVDLFFVLSGFLITGILIDSKGHIGYFKIFFARRALRILPLYYATLACVFVCIHLGFLAGSLDAEPYYWLYLQNWLRIDGDFYRIKILAHFWSLAVEEQFYLFWPFVIWALPRRAISYLCVGLVIGVCFLRCGLIHADIVEPKVTYYLTVTRIDTLAIGGVMAVLVRDALGMLWLQRVWKPVALLSTIVIAALIVLTGAFSWEDEPVAVYGYLALGLLFGSCIAASFLASPTGRFRSVLRDSRLRWIGKVSYGAYVIHWPVMVLLEKVWFIKDRFGYWPNQLLWWLVSFSLTFALAALSFRLFETRFLRLKERFTTKARTTPA